MTDSKIGAWKLDYQKAAQIKHLCKTTQLTDGQIASAFNISRVHVNHIRNDFRWADAVYTDLDSITPQPKEESVSNPLKMIQDFMTQWGIEKLEYQDIQVFMVNGKKKK